MRWDHINDGVWTIPTEPREKCNVGIMALNPIALEIIEAQPRLAGNPYVFPGNKRRRRNAKIKPSGPPAFNSFSQRKAELNKILPIPKWVLHDLRRTCRKLMIRAGVRPDVAELALGHSIKGIQAVYDNREEYQPLIDRTFQAAADEVEKVLNPPRDNVVALSARR